MAISAPVSFMLPPYAEGSIIELKGRDMQMILGFQM